MSFAIVVQHTLISTGASRCHRIATRRYSSEADVPAVALGTPTYSSSSSARNAWTNEIAVF